jgi:hypothetical protein
LSGGGHQVRFKICRPFNRSAMDGLAVIANDINPPGGS